MKTIMMNRFRMDAGPGKVRVWDVGFLKMVLLFVAMVVVWPLMQRLVLSLDVGAGYVDPGILMLVLLALLCFLVLVGLSWWLLQRFWLGVGLPGLGFMVLGFSSLELWVQLGFYFVCYALLLLAGVGCLVAVP